MAFISLYDASHTTTDKVNRRGLSNTAGHECLPKKDNARNVVLQHVEAFQLKR